MTAQKRPKPCRLLKEAASRLPGEVSEASIQAGFESIPVARPMPRSVVKAMAKLMPVLPARNIRHELVAVGK